MVSTYSAYNSVMRNLTLSTTRISQQSDVSRDAAYYKDNIGKVKTVDDFLDDPRLYQYAMKAYGLEDMIYAKAFMKQVLESDLSDTSSFANRLSDKRYSDFAAAFSFSGADNAVAQSGTQTDEMIGLYTKSVQGTVDAIDNDTGYYNATIGTVRNVDDLLNDDKLRNYVLSAFGMDDTAWSRDTIKQALTSDPADPTSYVNTVWVSQLDGINARIDKARADGIAAGAAIDSYTAQLSQPGADMAGLRAKITMERSVVAKSGGDVISGNDAITMIGNYLDLARGFEFAPDGTLPAGTSAQTDANRASTNDLFVNAQGAAYLAAEDDNEALLGSLFRSGIQNVTSVDGFIATPNVYNYALKAVGLDPDQVSAAVIKAVLKSDASDPRSYVYTLKDDRYVQLARAFNFAADGSLLTPLVAQNSSEVTQTAKNYIINKTKFTDGVELTDLRAAADKEVSYYQTAIAGIDSVSDLLADRRLVDIVLVSRGLQPENVTTDYLQKVFASDLTDPDSFANTEGDPRFAEIAASFNFNSDGNVARLAMSGPQTRYQLQQTQHDYLQQSLEAQQGDANQGVRLALYFQRKAGGITSAYDILADKALAEVFRTTFGLPDTFSAMDVDQQAKVVETYLDLNDLSDPDKLSKLMGRFSAMYDIKANTPATSPALTLLQGNSSTGFSADLYLRIAQMGMRS